MQEEELGAIYSQLGSEGLENLVSAFYRRVREDAILRPMYPEQDLQGAEDRLRDFLIYRFGGPPTYIEQRGHPALRMRHAPFPIDQQARDAWMNAMREAIREIECPARVASPLEEFLDATATFLTNRS